MKQKAKKGKKPSDKIFNVLAKAVADYIEHSGGRAVTVGGIGIAKRDRHRFTMEVEFVGTFPLEL